MAPRRLNGIKSREIQRCRLRALQEGMNAQKESKNFEAKWETFWIGWPNGVPSTISLPMAKGNPNPTKSDQIQSNFSAGIVMKVDLQSVATARQSASPVTVIDLRPLRHHRQQQRLHPQVPAIILS